MRIEIEKVDQFWKIFRRTVDSKTIYLDEVYSTKDEALKDAKKDAKLCVEFLGNEAVADQITIHEEGTKSWVSI